MKELSKIFLKVLLCSTTWLFSSSIQLMLPRSLLLAPQAPQRLKCILDETSYKRLEGLERKLKID